VASSANRTLISLADGASELACTAIAIRPTGRATASLSSVTVIGSGARTRIDWPRITLASPAEHFGQVAWVDGWASSPSSIGGAVTVNVQTTDVGTTSGAFGTLVSRTGGADKPWPVSVTAHFADGSQMTRTFVLDKAGTLAPRPGGGLSEADKIARYGAPGQSSTVTVRTTLRSATASGTAVTAVRVGTDVGVDIPAGALSGTVDVTVKRLTSRDMPPLDPGLVNVTAPD